MRFTTRIAVAVLTGALGLGVVGVAAPAQADTTWGYSDLKLGGGK